MIVIFLGGVILFIVIYCKFYGRYKRRKTEMAHVHYIANEGKRNIFVDGCPVRFDPKTLLANDLILAF